MQTLLNFTPCSWKLILRQNFTQLNVLADFLELSFEQRAELMNRKSFPLNLPFRLAQKIQKRTLDDPILKQFIPLLNETEEQKGFVLDPVGDTLSRVEKKLLHKYEGRVLLVCTSACAMHCRYCFRQNFDYDVSNKSFSNEIQLIAEDSSIHEVILSGGDPLSLPDQLLGELLDEIDQIPHIKRIRFHTRFPIGIPERISPAFLALLKNLTKQIWFVIHVNHPKELDKDIFEHLGKLRKIGCLVLNQSVLLKGINDQAETLKELCEMLVDQGIIPYYLHQLDRVQGAAHFEVEEQKGRALIQEISKSLPGYAIPKYVREISGEPYKTPL